MKLNNNTILITGGSSGIGLELARRLHKQGNNILICGRSEEKLNNVKHEIPGIHDYPCDLSIKAHRQELFQWVSDNHPSCNILINNAATVHKTNFSEDSKMIEKAENEVQTNLIAPITLSKLFLPLLMKNENASIINVTTGLIYAPRAAYPIYNATKSGLHAFTQVLRHQLKNDPIRVIEVIMSAVDTPWHQGNPPKMAISVEKAAAEMLNKLEKGQEVIKIAGVKILYILSRIAPAFAFRKINQL
ncbi:SDR family oxidoreductase [Fulvivirga sp. 29W222]|uniref:SDR family oxidoreductase n=1 Tax=Fulvivirga marina TaxID=2494733 RepID=A0A937FV53_9BACT|nr:SDR family NAD(P)-dependent oxidoreductase [Fulvivirga marina]MBL6446624.1 SDR family oxidoreductase [Fulvivirga marina]